MQSANQLLETDLDCVSGGKTDDDAVVDPSIVATGNIETNGTETVVDGGFDLHTQPFDLHADGALHVDDNDSGVSATGNLSGSLVLNRDDGTPLYPLAGVALSGGINVGPDACAVDFASHATLGPFNFTHSLNSTWGTTDGGTTYASIGTHVESGLGGDLAGLVLPPSMHPPGLPTWARFQLANIATDLHGGVEYGNDSLDAAASASGLVSFPIFGNAKIMGEASGQLHLGDDALSTRFNLAGSSDVGGDLGLLPGVVLPGVRVNADLGGSATVRPDMMSYDIHGGFGTYIGVTANGDKPHGTNDVVDFGYQSTLTPSGLSREGHFDIGPSGSVLSLSSSSNDFGVGTVSHGQTSLFGVPLRDDSQYGFRLNGTGFMTYADGAGNHYLEQNGVRTPLSDSEYERWAVY
jgi:hypothetical protein